MSDRASLATEGAGTCPFLGLAADRGLQAKVPDRRHRCYAEAEPTPRAMAHQEHYCLTPAFPACPTFQDWARREAMRLGALAAGSGAARDAGAGLAGGSGAASLASPPPVAPVAEEAEVESLWDEAPPAAATARDWTAPPPWVESPEPARDARAAAVAAPIAWTAADAGLGADTSVAAGVAAAGEAAPPPFLVGRAASAAPSGGTKAAPAAASVAGASSAAATPAPRSSASPTPEPVRGSTGSVGASAPGPGSTAPATAAAATGASRGYAGAHPAAPRARPRLARDDATPPWETPRRSEAYPSLRTRVGLPAIPRLGLYALALAIAALALFLLPTFLGGGGTSVPSATALPSAIASATPTLIPTPPTAPTAQVYVVVEGDTLSGIATRFGTTVSALVKANPQLKNPNSLQIGDQITIPARRIATPPPVPAASSAANQSAPPGGSAAP